MGQTHAPENTESVTVSFQCTEVQPFSVGFEGQRDDDLADVRSNFIE